MIVIAFGDVKPHEVGSVLQVVQALRSRAFPLEPALVEPEPPSKLLPAPAGVVPGTADSAPRGDPRPVNVNVVVNTGEQPGRSPPKDGAETAGQAAAALDTIRKHTDLLPGILDTVEATPRRTAGLLGGHGRRKFHTFGNVIEDGFSASAHFTNLTWGEKKYVIRRSAAVIVEALYIVLKVYELPGLGQNEVFAQIYGSDKKKWPSGNVRIQNFFRRGDAKRLWDDGLIGHDGKGSFHLNLKDIPSVTGAATPAALRRG